MPKTNLTILSSMAGDDFVKALDQHVAWGITVLDLKDGIFGKSVADLTEGEARRANALIEERGLSVYCLSTDLFRQDVECGGDEFRRCHLQPLTHVLELAKILKPRLVRLLAASTAKRADFKDSIGYVQINFPWLIRVYREAVERIDRAGFRTTIENDVGRCLFSTPDEIVEFFEILGHPERVCFTWDVRNLWECGTLPSLQVYAALKPLIGYVCLKGGQHGPTSASLRFRSALEDASWPVAEIVAQIAKDGVSPVICLNPSLGAPKPGYSYDQMVERDLAFARTLLSV